MGLALSDRFYNDEWEQVIQANGVTTRDEYLRVARTGRGVRLNRAARAEIWPVFEEYRAQLAERGVTEVPDCYRLARSASGAGPFGRRRGHRPSPEANVHLGGCR